MDIDSIVAQAHGVNIYHTGTSMEWSVHMCEEDSGTTFHLEGELK